MQRICSAAHIAIDATARDDIACRKIKLRFKSCRPDYSYLRNEPFDEHVEGLSYFRDKSSAIGAKRAASATGDGLCRVVSRLMYEAAQASA